MLDARLSSLVKTLQSETGVSASIYDTMGNLRASCYETIGKNMEVVGLTTAEKGSLAAYAPLTLDDGELLWVAVADNLTVAKLAAKAIKQAFVANQETFTLDDAIRTVLLGQIPDDNMWKLLEDAGLICDMQRQIIIFSTRMKNNEDLCNVIRQAFPLRPGEWVAEIRMGTVAMIRLVDEETTALSMAEMVLDTLQSDLMESAWAGIGQPFSQNAHWHKSYVQAMEALELGRIHCPSERRAFEYETMAMERFLHHIPIDIRKGFFLSMQQKVSPELWQDDLIDTAEEFMNNHLNLSETARDLFMHRNTLVYRLDKIQRETGLDLRRFNDAMTLRLLLAIRRTLLSSGELEQMEEKSNRH